MIVVEAGSIGQRVGLACENVTVCGFVVLQRMVGHHLYLALRHARSAGGADSSLAGVGRVDIVRQRGLEQRLAGSPHGDGSGSPVERDECLAGTCELVVPRPRALRKPARLARREKLEPDPVVFETASAQRFDHGAHHRLGAADQSEIDIGGFNPAFEQFLAFRPVDATGEKFYLQRVLLEYVDDVEATEMAVFQVLDLLAEHDRGHRAVCVDERES